MGSGKMITKIKQKHLEDCNLGNITMYSGTIKEAISTLKIKYQEYNGYVKFKIATYGLQLKSRTWLCMKVRILIPHISNVLKTLFLTRRKDCHCYKLQNILKSFRIKNTWSDFFLDLLHALLNYKDGKNSLLQTAKHSKVISK